MIEREAERPRGGALKRGINRLKEHPLVAFAIAVVGIGAFMIQAEDVITWGREKVDVIVNPNSAEYEALTTLDLDTRLEYFESNFGTAKAVYDLCRESIACTEEQENNPPRMYVHETDDVVIRAVFQDEQLEMYAITLMSDTLSPDVDWLDWPLGQLGEISFAEALDGVETVEGPTDVEIFMGA